MEKQSDLLKILAIVGPTASGKSDLALRLARALDGEIIAADSRTVYKEMNIGTAKPPRDAQEDRVHDSIQDLFGPKPYMVEGIAHWGFDLVTPDEAYDVSSFAVFARERIEDIAARGKLPIVVGGSGLYVQAIIDNPTFSEVKPNPELREELNTLSLEQLQARLRTVDAEAYELIDIQNPRRLVRAIEVVETTGKSWKSQQRKQDPYVDALQIGLELPREVIYTRCDARVDKMIAMGLVDEVRALLEKYGKDAPGMTGIGYRQIGLFLLGVMKLREAIEELKQDTRHYAKRQLTWFAHDPRVNWMSASDTELLYETALVRAQNFLEQ